MTQPTTTADGAGTADPCCGTAEAAQHAGSSCDPVAKTDALAAGASCCGPTVAVAADAGGIRSQVQARYADAATRAAEGDRCGSATFYPDDERDQLPDAAVRA